VSRAPGLASLCSIAAFAALGCRGESSGDTASGGASGNGGAGGKAGSGGGGVASCPFDALGSQRLVAIADALVADATWIADQSDARGVGATRAFGTAIALTSIELRETVTVSEACVGAKAFAADCSAPGAGEAFKRCKKLTCEAKDVLLAEVFVEPLPSDLPQSPPPGIVRLDELTSFTRFTENADGSLTVGVDGYLRMKLEDETSVRRTLAIDLQRDVSGDDTLDLVASVDGLVASTAQIDATLESGALAGSASVDGAIVATLGPAGFEPAGACAGVGGSR
jgi:hypothetical protein